jgi:hypothetical protein
MMPGVAILCPLMVEAVDFAVSLWNSPVPLVAVEQPVSRLASWLGPAHQSIQPWMFGHRELKRTCLWLHRLPLLRASVFVAGRVARVHGMAPGPRRQVERSRTFDGVAAAMAQQWGTFMGVRL